MVQHSDPTCCLEPMFKWECRSDNKQGDVKIRSSVETAGKKLEDKAAYFVKVPVIRAIKEKQHSLHTDSRKGALSMRSLHIVGSRI